MRDVLFIFSILSFIVLASGLKVTFLKQPVAATNNTYVWTRESNDPQDFFLQKIKVDGDDGPTNPSPPVAVPDLSNGEGQGLIHFNRAGVFKILAVDTQNPQDKPFFEMLVTVQVNSSSTTQPTGNGGGSNNGGGNDNNGGGGSPHNGNGHDDDDNHSSHGGNGHGKGGRGNQMNMDPPNSTKSSNDSSESASSQKAPQTDIPKIVGIVLGCISFMFLVAAILVYLRYRRRRQTNNFQQNMMTRSPGSITPWMEALPIDGMEKEYLSRNSSYTSNRSGHLRPPQVPVTTYSDPSVPPGLVGLGPSPPSPIRSDSVGNSISQRRPNDLGNGNPRGRNSGTSVTTLTLSSSGSRSNRSESASFVQFPVPSLPSRTRTDRQMMIEKEIQEMQGRILSLQTRPRLSDADAMEREEELRQITARVERLQRIHEGPWALGLSDTIPPGLT